MKNHNNSKSDIKISEEIRGEFAIFASEMKDITDIFNLADAQPQPASGSMLIAKPTVDDTCFSRSVIAVISHSAQSSMGLIINRPADITLNDVVPGLDTDEEIPMFIGGPVDLDTLFYLHTLGDAIPQSKQIAEGLYIGGDYDAMKRYINSGAPVYGKIKFLLGYSGWAAGQLAAEIDLHDWAVVPGIDLTMIMREGEDGIWRDAVNSLGERYRMWLNWPSNLTMN